MNMDIKDKIQQLRDQAEKYSDSGDPGKAIENVILAQWLEELVRYRKQQLDLKKSIDQYNKATCRITPECEMCDAWCEDGGYCELSLEEEKRKSDA